MEVEWVMVQMDGMRPQPYELIQAGGGWNPVGLCGDVWVVGTSREERQYHQI